MSEKTRSVMIRMAITVNVGPVPEDLTSHSQLFTFALAHVTNILKSRGLEAKIDGSTALASYDAGDGLATYTHLGDRLDDRHYRVQPADKGFALEVSTDSGETYVETAVFNDDAFARAIGDAWVDGRAEKAA